MSSAKGADARRQTEGNTRVPSGGEPDTATVLRVFRKSRSALLLLAVTLSLAQTYKPEAIQQANLGVSLSKKQDYRSAIQAYRRALAIDPRLPNLYLNLGLAYFKLGSFREALAALTKEPPSDQTTTLIGMSHFGLAEYKQAAATLQPLATAHPDNAELGYLLAKSYLWAGQHEQSMEMFRRLLHRDPDSAPAARTR